MENKSYPKILYYSDVPVELSSGGATLLYRLFEHYPKEKLVIIQGVGMNKNEPRIPGVKYYTLNAKLERLRFTRFAKYTKALFIAAQFLNGGIVKRIIKQFQPDLIVTVSIRLMWHNAFSLSKKYKIPLYLILHDDWLTSENYGKWQLKLSRVFGNMYRYASDRFCISPTMENYYFSLYGVHGKVIFPSRGKDDQLYPIITEKKSSRIALKYCYIGSLFTGDFAPMLDDISYHIAKEDGELHVFSYWDKEILSKYPNLNKSHVVFHPFMKSGDLMRLMNEEMDVAILLNSFLHEEPFRYNFSSKLVDYISAGLPVMFWGPASSGSIAWALSVGYKAVVTEKDANLIGKLIEEFHDGSMRMNWSKEIRQAGVKEFSYEKNFSTFLNAITV